MKKYISLSLIILFLIYTNCKPRILRQDYGEALAASQATYIQGSIDIGRGEKGVLLLKNESIQFKYKGEMLDIPYDNITNIQYDEKRKNIIPKVPSPNFGYYREAKTDVTFLEALLYFGVLIIIVVTGVLLLRLSEKHVYFTIDYIIDDNNEWVAFKVNKGEFDKLYPILREKTS